MTTSTATMLDHVAYPLHERCKGKLISKRLCFCSLDRSYDCVHYASVMRSPPWIGPSVADPERPITALAASPSVARSRDTITKMFREMKKGPTAWARAPHLTGFKSSSWKHGFRDTPTASMRLRRNG